MEQSELNMLKELKKSQTKQVKQERKDFLSLIIARATIVEGNSLRGGKFQIDLKTIMGHGDAFSQIILSWRGPLQMSNYHFLQLDT